MTDLQTSTASASNINELSTPRATISKVSELANMLKDFSRFSKAITLCANANNAIDQMHKSIDGMPACSRFYDAVEDSPYIWEKSARILTNAPHQRHEMISNIVLELRDSLRASAHGLEELFGRDTFNFNETETALRTTSNKAIETIKPTHPAGTVDDTKHTIAEDYLRKFNSILSLTDCSNSKSPFFTDVAASYRDDIKYQVDAEMAKNLRAITLSINPESSCINSRISRFSEEIDYLSNEVNLLLKNHGNDLEFRALRQISDQLKNMKNLSLFDSNNDIIAEDSIQFSTIINQSLLGIGPYLLRIPEQPDKNEDKEIIRSYKEALSWLIGGTNDYVHGANNWPHHDRNRHAVEHQLGNEIVLQIRSQVKDKLIFNLKNPELSPLEAKDNLKLLYSFGSEAVRDLINLSNDGTLSTEQALSIFSDMLKSCGSKPYSTYPLLLVQSAGYDAKEDIFNFAKSIINKIANSPELGSSENDHDFPDLIPAVECVLKLNPLDQDICEAMSKIVNHYRGVASSKSRTSRNEDAYHLERGSVFGTLYNHLREALLDINYLKKSHLYIGAKDTAQNIPENKLIDIYLQGSIFRAPSYYNTSLKNN